MTNGNAAAPSLDQEFPLFTSDGAFARPSADGDQTPNIMAVLRDILGVRPSPGDSKAFRAALDATFRLRLVEGHVESEYVPRGFAVQADLGAVSGGQASLYARASFSLGHLLSLLDGLTPLNPDYDEENAAATRAIIRNELSRIVQEIGTPGGPRVDLVDASFEVLLEAGGEVVPDEVGGQLGALRDRFGLIAGNVNTVEEERIRTTFWTLVNGIQDVKRTWDLFTGQRGSAGFLGTDFVLLARLMEAAAEQVDEYERVLDSVLIGPAERQTITLGDGTGTTVDGLLSWTRRFLREDGRSYLTDSGRIGLEKAFLPMIIKLIAIPAEPFRMPDHRQPLWTLTGAGRAFVYLTALDAFRPRPFPSTITPPGKQAGLCLRSRTDRCRAHVRVRGRYPWQSPHRVYDELSGSSDTID